MKQKLILLQPKKYNELFSSYHTTKRNFNINSRVDLPKISTNFPKEWETTSSSSRINNTSSTYYKSNQYFSSKKNSYIFDKNKEFFYPMVTQTKGSLTALTSDFLPYPSITQHYKKIIDYRSKDKKKCTKTKTDLKMIYLNLIKGDRNENRNNFQIDSFLSDYDENEKIKNDIINNKINEMNKKNKQKIDNIFNQVEASKIRNDIAMIDNIPVVLINFYAQDIYYNYYHNTNKGILNIKKSNKLSNMDIDNNNNLESLITNFNKNVIQRNKYVNNVFFQYILDNVRHKIEILTQNNKHITIVYVKNLINSEIKSLQSEISDYKKQYNTNSSQFTGNNASKISNYETASKNTFKYRTNNSSIKDNENASTNNNSSLLGNLIKNNIYSKKNAGKKRKFETMNIFHKVDPNKFFQNKEIISSIKQKDKIEEYKNKKNKKDYIKNDSENEDKTKDKFNLTTNSFDYAAHRKIKSRLFQRDASQKKLERTFSDVYLNRRYKKASEFITAISNDIERRYRLRHRDSYNDYYYDSYSYTNKDKKGIIKNIKRSKYKNVYDNNYKGDNYNDDNDRESFMITPIKDKQSIGVNTDFRGNKINFKNENMKNNYEGMVNTLNTIKENNNYYLTPDKINSKETKYINKGNEKDILLINNNLNNDENNNKNKNGKEKKNQKMAGNKTNNKNTDLKSIKISKNSNSKDLDKYGSKNNNNRRGSNASIKGANQLNNNKINEEDYEDEEYEEEDDDEDEEEEDEEDEFLTEKERLIKKLLKKMKKKKNKNGDEDLQDDENIKQGDNKNNARGKNSRRNSLIGHLSKNRGTNSIKNLKSQKGLKASDSQKNMNNSSKGKSTINKDGEDEDEEYDELEDFDDPELLKEMEKYHLDKKELSKLLSKLSKDKKKKRKGGFADKFHKGGKDTDEDFLLKEKDIEAISGEKRSDANFDRDEEIKILKEIEELDEALTLDEKQFMIKEILELRNLLVKEPKRTKEIREKINEKRLALFEIVDKFFINWIIKDLALKVIDIKKYKHKLDKLVYIQNYRIYSVRNLRLLEDKYIKPYIEEENRKKREEEEKKEKSKRKKISDEEFKRFKRMIEAKKKNKELIFDNSYLFKKGKIKKFKLRKEVEEILNTDYGLYYHGKSGSKKKGKRKKKSKKNGKNIMQKFPKSSIFNNVELTQEEMEDEERRQRLLRDLEEKEKMEEMREKRLYDFFARIQRLKNGKIKNFEEELNLLINEQIDEADRIRARKEARMNYFLQEFQLNRVKAKYFSDYKNKKLDYLSPLIFTTENKK